MHDKDPDAIYEALYRLAFENPRAARSEVAQLLKSDEDILRSVLRRISEPGNGRLRQLIANAVASEQDRKLLQPHLAQWLTVETDEFARRAIEQVLRTVGENRVRQEQSPPVSDPLLVDMYRYVTGRFGHELRNAMLAPQTRLLRLRSAVERVEDPDVQSTIASLLAQLEDDFVMVGRICAFNPTAEHFTIQSLVLCDWIKAMNADYAQSYNAVELGFDGNLEARQVRILASHHYLRMVFWNLWVNAHQATGDPCKITIHADIAGPQLALTLLDNGDGFPDHLNLLAFKDHVSTKCSHRGRGLLEVQHAMETLHGQAHLMRQVSGELRVALTFPREGR